MNDGVMRLVRQTVDGLADLVVQHLKLARLELAGDMVAVARRARVIAVFAVLAVVGYALTMAGVAVLVGGNSRMGGALAVVGLVHLGAGALAMLLASPSAGGAGLMDASTDEMKRSLAALGSVSTSMATLKTDGT
jgi:hypothetical protein